MLHRLSLSMRVGLQVSLPDTEVQLNLSTAGR
jgi:hypothetical protein